MRKLILKWLRGVDSDLFNEMIASQVDVNQSLIEQTKNLTKAIDALKGYVILGDQKYELILKYGCFDCFSIEDEWHKSTCVNPQAHDDRGNLQLVRRNNGRHPVGHS